MHSPIPSAGESSRRQGLAPVHDDRRAGIHETGRRLWTRRETLISQKSAHNVERLPINGQPSVVCLFSSDSLHVCMHLFSVIVVHVHRKFVCFVIIVHVHRKFVCFQLLLYMCTESFSFVFAPKVCLFSDYCTCAPKVCLFSVIVVHVHRKFVCFQLLLYMCTESLFVFSYCCTCAPKVCLFSCIIVH